MGVGLRGTKGMKPRFGGLISKRTLLNLGLLIGPLGVSFP